MSVVFSTPGLIPLEAFTIFGASAKPNSKNPIGIFGTGLKIGVAVCLRMGQEVILYRGDRKYTFYTKQGKFRDKEFDFIYMKTQTWLGNLWNRGGVTKLPFTTELGKTWELWQAFREFHANTLDEGGRTYINKHSTGLIARGDDDHTHLVVIGQRFEDEYHDRNRTFLEDGLSERTEESGGIQIINRPSKHVYYRGMRIMDLRDEAARTYNFLRAVDLTEDRTAKYPVLLEMELCQLVAESEDEELIDDVVPDSSYSGPRRWEHSFSYGYTSVSRVSPTFVNRAREAKSEKVRELWDQHQPTVPTKTILMITIPKSEVTDEELIEIQEAIEGIVGPHEVKRT